MKFIHAAVYALTASHAAHAVPVAESSSSTGLVEHRSANPQRMALMALDERSMLEKRINCRDIHRVVHSIGTSKMTVVYITLATTLTRSVCAYVNGERCGDLAYIIQTGFTLIYVAAAHYSGAQPEMLPGAKKRDDGDVHAAYVHWWIDLLSQSPGNLAYESITTLPFDQSEEALSRRDGDPALVSRVLFSGVTGPANPTAKQDIIANHFADGNTLLHLPIGGSNTTSSLTKRVPGGSGFKMSFTTRDKSLLTASHQQEMSAYAAASWAATSDAYSMTDYIGFAETDHSSNFYYRIIPEVRGFGLNYESVDICGGMVGFL